LIISGPPSSGKSYMAHKLAQFLVESTGDVSSKSASIVTFTIQVLIPDSVQ
jgi:tRNA uridine 5-carbamoylmethylation protein Kti12